MSEIQHLHHRRPTGVTPLWLFASLGGLAQAGQVVFLRELLTLAYGTELTIALVLGFWLVMTALGSATVARWLSVGESQAKACGYYAIATVVVTLVVFLDLWILRCVRGWWDIPPGEPLTVVQLLLITFIVLTPFCGAMGAQFVFAAAVTRSAGGVYVAECIGAAVVGGLLGFALLRWLDHFPLMALFLLTHLLTTTALLWRFSPSSKFAQAFLGLMSGVVLIISPLCEHQTQQRFWRSLLPSMRLLRVQASPYGNIAVVDDKGQISTFQNGRLLFTLPEQGETAPLTHLIMLQHPKPQRILLVGGMGGWLKAMLQHPTVVGVDWVELDPTVMETTLPFLPPSERRAFTDPRVLRYTDDGRSFVHRANARYDVIFVVAADPTTAALNRYFTREFFLLARQVLNDDGILALRGLAEPPAGLGEFYLARNRIVFETMRSIFPEVLAVPSHPITLLATERQTLTLDETLLLRRAAERGLGEVNLFAYTDPMQVQRVAHELRTGQPFNPLKVGKGNQQVAPVITNTDANPVVYFLSSLLWVRMSDQRLSRWLETVARFPSAWFWAVAFIPSLWLFSFRRQTETGRQQRLLLAITVMGLFGMAMELIILLMFQSRFGTLYQQVGSLFALFMVGLTVGSWQTQRHSGGKTTKALAMLLIVAGCFGLTWLGVSEGVAELPDFFAWGIYGVAITLTGGLVGAAFPMTVRSLRHRGIGSERAAGLAYAFDLLGGALGALFIGAILLPLQGTPMVLAFLVLLCVTTSITVWWESVRRH